MRWIPLLMLLMASVKLAQAPPPLDAELTATVVIAQVTQTAAVFDAQAVPGTPPLDAELTATVVIAQATQTAAVFDAQAVPGTPPLDAELTATVVIAQATQTAQQRPLGELMRWLIELLAIGMQSGYNAPG